MELFNISLAFLLEAKGEVQQSDMFIKVIYVVVLTVKPIANDSMATRLLIILVQFFLMKKMALTFAGECGGFSASVRS